MSSILCFQPLETLPKWMDSLQPAIFGPTTQGQRMCNLPLPWAGYHIAILHICHMHHVFRAVRPPQVLQLFQKKLDGQGFVLLAGEAAYISRQSNKRASRFASSKFPHCVLLSLLSSLVSEDDISTLSSRLCLAFHLPPLPGSSIFHPPWCLPAQRAAPRLSSPKQAAFISGSLESHRNHLGSVIFF